MGGRWNGPGIPADRAHQTDPARHHVVWDAETAVPSGPETLPSTHHDPMPAIHLSDLSAGARAHSARLLRPQLLRRSTPDTRCCTFRRLCLALPSAIRGLRTWPGSRTSMSSHRSSPSSIAPSDPACIVHGVRTTPMRGTRRSGRNAWLLSTPLGRRSTVWTFSARLRIRRPGVRIPSGAQYRRRSAACLGLAGSRSCPSLCTVASRPAGLRCTSVRAESPSACNGTPCTGRDAMIDARLIRDQIVQRVCEPLDSERHAPRSTNNWGGFDEHRLSVPHVDSGDAGEAVTLGTRLR